MDCPESAVLEAVARGDLVPWPSGLEHHLDGCVVCMQALVEAGARHPPTLADDDEGLDDPERDLPPMAEDRYEFLGELGRGGQSRVFRAFDRLLRHDVAFKQFVPRGSEPAAERIARARFVREVGIMADLGHPGVIPILDLGLRDGWPYCTMQVVEGETLTEARTRPGADPPALDRLLSHFAAVCETVDFAHGLGIVHRDLKPENIMLGAFGQTYVLDWALAKRLQGGDASRSIVAGPVQEREPWTTELGTMVGTPAYMSPEHLGADVGADPASDIWSLGAVLFFIVKGQPPFVGDQLEQLLTAVQSAHQEGLPAQRLAGIPRELAMIISRAMSVSREHRYRDAGAIARDIEAYRTDRPVSVVEYTRWQRLARAVRHHPSMVVAAVVVTIVAAVGFAVTWQALRREAEAHDRTAAALHEATRAREESERLFSQERERAAEVTAALVHAHAERAVQLRADRHVLSARAEAAYGLLALRELDVTRLPASDQSTLDWASARLRGEMLTAERDVVRGYEGFRPRSGPPLRTVERGGHAYIEATDDDSVLVRRISDGSVAATFDPEGRDVTAIALSKSGTRAATVLRDAEGRATIVSWSVVGADRTRWAVPVKRDGLLAVADDGTVAANTPDDEVVILRPGAADPLAVARIANWFLALSADGSTLAISGNDGELPVLDTRNGRPVLDCPDHADRLTALTVTPSRVLAGCVSGHLVTCTADDRASVKVHRERVTAVELAEGGRFAFSGGLDHRLAVTDLAAGDVLARVDAPREHVYNLAHDAPAGVIHAFTTHGVHTWKVAFDTQFEVRSHAHAVQRHHDFDGRTFLLPHGMEPRLIEVDATTGRDRALELPDAEPPAFVLRHQGTVYTIAFSGRVTEFEDRPEGVVRVGGWDGEGRNFNTAATFEDLIAIEHKSPYGVRLFEVETGRRVRAFEGHDRAVFAIAFSSDGTRLASGDADGRILVFDVASGERMTELAPTGASVFGLAFDPDQGVVATSTDGVRWWPDSGTPQSTALDDSHAYRLMALDPVHRRVVAARTDVPHLAVWSLVSGRRELEVSSSMGIQDLALSPDGNVLYWLSPTRMQRLELPPPSEIDGFDDRAENALYEARSERTVLLRSAR